jgi:hypothetical protein
MSNCELCSKKIVSIGHKRKNGKNHKDWDSRKYHKKCYNLNESYEKFKIVNNID